jgi:hypothetical protein
VCIFCFARRTTLGTKHQEYIDWQGNYLDYDLRGDTKKALGQERRAALDGRLFSVCRVYPTEANPDPLHKVDDGDRGAGHMRVTVERCNDLLALDLDGKSDPKVKMAYEVSVLYIYSVAK